MADYLFFVNDDGGTQGGFLFAQDAVVGGDFFIQVGNQGEIDVCLLYTSDAADD